MAADIVVPTATESLPATDSDIRLSPTSYLPAAGYSWQAWVEDGARFAGVGMSLLWWIGDWALFGEQAYGQDVYQAFADCGYEDDTIRDAMRVCRAWPQKDRCPDLSYGHHRLLVTIPEERRAGWVDDAMAFGWSVRDLRTELSRAKRNREMIGMMAEDSLYHILLVVPPYGDGPLEWPALPMADDSMLLLACFGHRLPQAVGDLDTLGYRVAGTMVLRPPVTAPEPRDQTWVTPEASLVLIGVRGDLRAPLADEVPNQFPSNLYDLGVQLDRAFPHLKKATAWTGLDHPAWSNLAPGDPVG